MRICFVCLGNICRSPTAEGIFRALVREAGLDHQITCDSAGTASFHVGEPPHRQTRATATARGTDLSDLRGWQFRANDFDRFDLVVAMDADNVRDLQRLARTDDDRQKITLLRSYDPHADHHDVPDPWGGSVHEFESVYDVVHAACVGLLASIR